MTKKRSAQFGFESWFGTGWRHERREWHDLQRITDSRPLCLRQPDRVLFGCAGPDPSAKPFAAPSRCGRRAAAVARRLYGIEMPADPRGMRAGTGQNP